MKYSYPNNTTIFCNSRSRMAEFRKITEMAKKACGFVCLPRDIAVGLRRMYPDFDVNARCAYEILEEDNEAFEYIQDDLSIVQDYSAYGRFANYYTNTTNFIDVTNDETGNYIVFWGKNVILMERKTDYMKCQCISVSDRYIRSQNECDKEFRQTHIRVICENIEILSKKNRRRRITQMIGVRMCLRKSLGLGR